jgi:hypothetical protein
VRISRDTRALTASSVSADDAVVRISAMPSPVEENTGKLDA